MNWWTVGGALILVTAIILLRLNFGKSSTGSSSTRACPVCGAKLDQDERLFADEVKKSEEVSELKIKGCTHCYKN